MSLSTSILRIAQILQDEKELVNIITSSIVELKAHLVDKAKWYQLNKVFAQFVNTAALQRFYKDLDNLQESIQATEELLKAYREGNSSVAVEKAEKLLRFVSAAERGKRISCFVKYYQTGEGRTLISYRKDLEAIRDEFNK